MLVAATFSPGRVPAAAFFSEDFETGGASWVLESPWAVTNEAAHGGTYSLTDNPGALYGNNVDKKATVPMNLVGSNRPLLSFWHRYNLEDKKDYGYVEVSKDSGATWSCLFFATGDSASQWFKEEIDLSPFANKQVQLRFRIKTDGSGQREGWYVDDVDVSENGATTPFPFLDDAEMESSDANWIASSWERVATEGRNSIHCWTRTAMTARSDFSTGLVLRGATDLASAVNPHLSFWHHKNGSGEVYVSSNGGQTWTRIYNDGTTWTDWRRSQLDLSAYMGLPNIVVRFSMGSGQLWSVDDVLISDAPQNVFLQPLSDAAEHSLTLTWTQNTDTDFASYRIYRSLNADMSSATELPAITNQATTTYTDTDLIFAATSYYYRVYVVDTEELRNQGSNVQGAKTLLGATVHTFPFTDDMESGDTWGNDWPWGLTDTDSYSGTYCWTDSPGASYQNNIDRSLTTAIDLTGSNRPLLSFWHRYNLEDKKDYGYVEVSKDAGATWSCLFFTTGNSATQWFKEEIDLSAFVNKQVYLAFRIKTDGSGQQDGWYVDDVEVSENTATTPFPFLDDAETASSDANWIASSWERIATDGHNSSHCWTRPAMNARSDFSTGLVLRGATTLATAINPHLSFWHHKSGSGEVYVSSNGGQTWTRIYNDGNTWTDWRRTQLDLSAYMGLPNIVVRFSMGSGQLWSVDDVLISDAPQNVFLQPLSDVAEHSLTLTWAQNTDADFASYRIYRSLNADMSSATELPAITNQATTTYTDTDLTFAATWYYYRIYVVDTEELRNQGSNVQGAKTLLGAEAHTFPFTDDMESGDTWGNDLPWGLTDTASHSGTYCWTDSPGTSYQNNIDRSLTTVIDLTGSTRPSLSFWHRYILEDKKDYGYVEVSKDAGVTWSCLFFTTGNSANQWFREEIDLSAFTNQQIYLAFRIKTDGAGQQDGWYVDDVEVSENNATTPLPFLDDAETASSDANWIASSWERIPTDGHDSTHCWTRPAMIARSDFATELVLRGTIDLTHVSNPKLSFWHHKNGTGQVYVSSNGGQTWTRIYNDGSTWTDWREKELDLSAYVGSADVVVKFSMGYGQLWSLDDIEITGEITAPPTLTIFVEGGVLRLSWSQFGTGQYTVERSDDLTVWTPEAGMPITDTVFSIGDPASLPRRRFYRVSAP
jgi:hypothetical protein